MPFSLTSRDSSFFPLFTASAAKPVTATDVLRAAGTVAALVHVAMHAVVG